MGAWHWLATYCKVYRAYLLEDLCGEVHDSIDAAKLLQDKQHDTNLDAPHTQQLCRALLDSCCLAHIACTVQHIHQLWINLKHCDLCANGRPWIANCM